MLLNYFKELNQTFEKANTSTVNYQLSIANKNVRLTFSNPLLAQNILPALLHLESNPDGQEELTIKIWDSKTSGIPLPLPFSEEGKKHIAQQQCWGYHLRNKDSNKIRLYYVPPPNEYMCIFDSINRKAIYWYQDAAALPYPERGAPLQTIFDWWLTSRGLLFTHAAAIGNDKGGVLIVGLGGQGKSTTALSCLSNENLYYLSDDYLILEPKFTPVVHSIYNTGKLHYPHLENKLPHLLPLLDNPTKAKKGEKALLFLHQTHQTKIRTSLPIIGAVLPEVSNKVNTTIVPVHPMKLLKGLAASTILRSTSEPTHALKSLTTTLKNLPCYALQTGSDMEAIPEGIEKIIDLHGK